VNSATPRGAKSVSECTHRLMTARAANGAVAAQPPIEEQPKSEPFDIQCRSDSRGIDGGSDQYQMGSKLRGVLCAAA